MGTHFDARRQRTRLGVFLGACALVGAVAAAVIAGTPGSPGDTTADFVFGQGSSGDSFTTDSSVCSGLGTAPLDLCGPQGVTVDSGGNVYIADTRNGRVLEFNQPLVTRSAIADEVFGGGSSGSEQLSGPQGLATDSAGNLYVADAPNYRLIGFYQPLAPGGGTPGTPGSAGDTTADFLFGQASLTSFQGCNRGGNPTAATLCNDGGVAVDSEGNVYAADAGNNRVLEYYQPLASASGCMPHPDGSGCPGDAVADLVLGQSGFTTNFNNGLAGQVGQDTLSRPDSVALDMAGNLYVSDSANNRVLGWKKASRGTNGAPADIVIGQPNFNFGSCNDGTAAGDVSGLGADSLCGPVGVAVDLDGNLYVSDTQNNRLLEYNTPFNPDSGEPGAGDSIADRVFGTCGGGFTSNDCSGVTADSLAETVGLAFDSANDLFVADYTYNRVLEYDLVTAISSGAPTPTPTAAPTPTATPTPTPTATPTAAPTPTPTAAPTPTPTPAPTPTPTPAPTPTAIPAPTQVAAKISGTPTALTFAARVMGTSSKPQTLMLTNAKNKKQNQTITIIGIGTTGDFTAPAGECVGALAPGKKCKLSVTFKPSGTGSRKGKLTVTSDAENPSLTISLKGTGKR